jgi:hypothetical protein
MRNKIKLLKRYKDIMMNFEVPQELKSFNTDLIQWLENSVVRAFVPFTSKTGAIGNQRAMTTFDQSALSDEFAITKEGGIFR